MHSVSPVSHDFIVYQGPQEGGDNFLRRTVEWLREDRPAYQQALIYTAFALTVIGLIASVVGIPVVVNMIQEAKNINVQANVLAGDAKIKQAIGGEARYEKLHTLKFGDRALDVDVEINPSHMNHSLMSGNDKYGRPFLAMKLLDREDGQQFVQVVFRKYTYEQEWDYSRGAKTIFTGYGIDQKALETMKAIVEGRHQRYRLT